MQHPDSSAKTPTDLAALYPQNNQHRYLKQILKQQQKSGIGVGTGKVGLGSLKNKNSERKVKAKGR